MSGLTPCLRYWNEIYSEQISEEVKQLQKDKRKLEAQIQRWKNKKKK